MADACHDVLLAIWWNNERTGRDYSTVFVPPSFLFYENILSIFLLPVMLEYSPWKRRDISVLYEYLPVIPDSGLCYRAAIVESASVIFDGISFRFVLGRAIFTCFRHLKPRIIMNMWTADCENCTVGTRIPCTECLCKWKWKNNLNILFYSCKYLADYKKNNNFASCLE